MKYSTLRALVIVLVWVCILVPVFAQITTPSLIIAAEYFFDTDPGMGNGTPVAITPGTDITHNLHVDTSSLAVGVHRIYIRTMNEEGIWGMPQFRTFLLQDETVPIPDPIFPVTAAEYFIDIDPGMGNGVPIAITPGTDIAHNLHVDTSSLPVGVHRIYIRTMNEEGIWGMPQFRTFLLQDENVPIPDPIFPVTAAEYFIDIDPGMGNGTPVAITPGTDITHNLHVDTSSLAVGVHRIYILTMNEEGVWGMPQFRTFLIQEGSGPAPVSQIITAEYFIDTDPGMGSGVQIAITPGTDITHNLHVDTSSLAVGTHRVFIRTCNAEGVWGIPQFRTFLIQEGSGPAPVSQIIAAEYFIDTDPGMGNGVPIAITPGTDITHNLHVDTSSLAVGTHRIYIRAMNAEGIWGLLQNREFEIRVEPHLLPPPGLVAMNEGESLTFAFIGFEPQGNPLQFEWLLDGVAVSADSSFTFTADYNSAGVYSLSLSVSEISRNQFSQSRDIASDRYALQAGWTLVVSNSSPFELLYSNDFETGTTDGFSSSLIDVTPIGARSFLGRFSNDAVSLSLDELPSHDEIKLEFDLYLIDTWDGNSTISGPDFWSLTADDQVLLNTTFTVYSMYSPSQSYPENYPADYPPRTGAVENNSLGYSWDSVYHLSFTIPHTDNDITVVFQGSNLQGVIDESWGIDNVMISYRTSSIVVQELEPPPGEISIIETQSQEFTFSGSSPNGDLLQYMWSLDDAIVSTEDSYIFSTDFGSLGSYNLNLLVYLAEPLRSHRDGINTDREVLQFTWTINVLENNSVSIPDSLALIALYNATGGPNWINNTNWLSDEPLSSWYGVTVSEGRVTQLSFYDNNLVGVIPPEIGNLTGLTSLQLSSGHLSGPIPPEIGNLTDLTLLSLSNNQLSGSIPTSLWNLSNLSTLHLGSNYISGSIPSEIGNLVNLTYLDMGNNQLSGYIPSEIGNLINLTFINFGLNLLENTIPAELWNLTNLLNLQLNSNNLSGVISSNIGTLVNLNILSLSSNQFSGTIPPDIGNLVNLTYLSLSNNQLIGSIPSSIGNLSNLQQLVLDSNQLSGTIPSEIGNLTNLRLILARHNQLSGSIPSSIGNLSTLQGLWLESNQLSGTIPPEIWSLPNLRSLLLYDNQLSGTIAPEIGNLSNLEYLYLGHNQFSGSLPSEIGSLNNVINIVLDGNQLSGTIPSSIGNMTNLNVINLHGNQLSGPIPPEIGNLTNLTQLDLSSNLFSGQIPEEMGNLTDLTNLFLYSNQLSGSIPASLGNLTNLTWLYVNDNRLSGSTPNTINNLSNLVYLHLEDNFLGELPAYTGLDSLQYIYVQNNHFTFEDIEPNVDIASEQNTYSPQRNVHEVQDLTLMQGASYLFDSSIGGTQNVYQWYKDGSPHSTEAQFTIDNLQLSDSGVYTCSISSALVPGLTIQREPITIEVVAVNHPPEIVLPASLDIPQNELSSFDFSPYVSDPDGDQLSLSVSGNQQIGVEIDGLTVHFNPAVNWLGSELLTFTVDDGVIEERLGAEKKHSVSTRLLEDSADKAARPGGRLSDSAEIMINVFNPLEFDFSASNAYNNNLVAGEASTAVQFEVTSNFPLVSWAWDFDSDGVIDSTEPSPSWYYDTPGWKSVSLEVSDGVHVNWLTKTDYLLVHPGVLVVSGVVFTDLLWTETGGPYNLLGEVVLAPSANLTILPNTQVNLLVDSLLVVNGSLNAQDASFSSFGEQGWNGIVLNSGAETSVIEDVHITGAARGFVVNDCNPILSNILLTGRASSLPGYPAIQINGTANPGLSGLQISKFSVGIQATNQGSSHIALSLDETEIFRDSLTPHPLDTGIELIGNYSVEIEASEIIDFLNGIRIQSNSPQRTQVRLTNTRVRTSESSSRGALARQYLDTGFELVGNYAVEIEDCEFEDYLNGILIQNTNAQQAPARLTNTRVRTSESSSRGAMARHLLDTGIELAGNYAVEIEDCEILEYQDGIRILGTDPLRSPARLTNTRVRTTESSSRNPAKGIFVSGISSLIARADSICGYPRGIEVQGGLSQDIALQIASVSIIRQSPHPAGDSALVIGGRASGAIDSLMVLNYHAGIALSGSQELDLQRNQMINCGTAISAENNPRPLYIGHNLIHRNASYEGDAALSAFAFEQCSAVTMLNNTLYGYPYYLQASSCDALSLSQNILWVDAPLSEPILLSGGTALDATFNDIGLAAGIYPGAGNINANPLFEDAEQADFSLNVYSPCIDAGNPANPPDPDGSIADLGAIPYDQTTMPLIADFFYDVASGPHPLTVQFTDHSTFNAISWAWDFNADGQTDSTDPSPSWVFNSPGVYSVSLRVYDGTRYASKVCPDLISTHNIGPILFEPLPDLVKDEDFGSVVINLADYFFDANADELIFSCSHETELISSTLEGSVFTIYSRPDLDGEVEITIQAEDGYRGRNIAGNPPDSKSKSLERSLPRLGVSDSFRLSVLPVNDAPVIHLFTPADSLVTIEINSSLSFAVEATDVDSELSYRWYVNSVDTGVITPEFTFHSSDEGEYLIQVIIDDGDGASCELRWRVLVNATPPASMKLWQNYPNPFKYRTNLKYSVDTDAVVNLRIYNIRGQMVRDFKPQSSKAGTHLVEWDGTDMDGNRLPGGVYILGMKSGNYKKHLKMLLLTQD